MSGSGPWANSLSSLTDARRIGYLTVTVSFFVELGAPLVALAVKVTFAVPVFLAVMLVIDVPGASG